MIANLRLVAGFLALFASNAAAQQNEIYASLERVADTAARIESVYCPTDEGRLFQGAIDGVNAARPGEPPITLPTRDIRSFANAYADMLEAGGDHIALEEAAVGGMIRAFDESGEYLPADTWRPGGDGGVLLTLQSTNTIPVVVNSTPDGPAARAGLRRGDRIVSVDGLATQGQPLHEIVQGLRGDIGSTISITIERDGIEIPVTMVRELARPRPPVAYRVVDNIGIITIEAFPENSAERTRDAIRDIRHQLRRPGGYVIDLRDNAGGLLDQAIEIADLFIDGGPVLAVRPVSECADQETQNYHARRRDESEGARLIVLVNESTASGAEALAASLREMRGATLVGQTSSGQSRVHTVIPMRGGRDGYLRLRTGTLTTPSGATWENVGLTPDLTAPPLNEATDPTLAAALALLSTDR